MTIRPFRSALLLLAGMGTASPALAQYYYGPGYGYGPPEYGRPSGPYSYNAPPPEYGRDYNDYPAPHAPRPLSARRVADLIERMGYENVGAPRFTGTLYIVHATAGGVHQELVVDAIRGVILNRTAIGPAPYGSPEGAPPRRYGGRPLDSDDLERTPEIAAPPRRAAPRRQAARPAPLDTGAPEARPPQEGGLPAPADPRLDPSAQPPQAKAPRPFEGQTGKRQARTEPRSEPKETGARPFGLNPPTPAQKENDGRKASQPPAPVKKPIAAEARPIPADKPVRIIEGVTPINPGESRSQLDNLPKPPEPAAPTGE